MVKVLLVDDDRELCAMQADYLAADISGIVELHRDHYPVGVLNNLYFCTLALRDYRTQETRLAFPSLEFHYLSQRAEGIDAAI